MTTNNADIKIEDVSRQLTTIFNIDNAIGREWTKILSDPNFTRINTVFALKALMAGRTSDLPHDVLLSRKFFDNCKMWNPSDETPDWTPGQVVHLFDSTKHAAWHIFPNGDVTIHIHRDGEEKVTIGVSAKKDAMMTVAYSPVTTEEDWYKAYKALMPVRNDFTAFATMAKYFSGFRD